MRWVVMMVVLAACSDDLHPVPRIEPESGARLAIGAFRFDGGAELSAPSEIYDKLAHVRCAPGRWADGEERCVALADEAFYSDATCETFVGRGDTDAHPTAFLGYEEKQGVRRPAHLLRAGAATTAPTGIYTMRDGTCTGPAFTDPSITYFSIPGEYEDAVAFGADEVIGDAIALELTTATDGARFVSSYRDVGANEDCTLIATHRCVSGSGGIDLAATVEDVPPRRIQRIELTDGAVRFFDLRMQDTQLGIDCVPQMVGDTWRCMPELVTGSATYHAAGCVDPLVVAIVSTARPAAFVSVQGPDGSELHAVGGPITPFIGTPLSCAPAPPAPNTEFRAVGALAPPESFASAVLYTAR